jgi:hypothetical protein
MNKLIESMDSEVDQQPLTTHATRILIPNHPMPSHWRHWNSDQKEKYCSAAIDILGHRDAIEALYRLHRSESGSDGVYQFMAELLDMQLDGVGDEFTLNHYASVILKFAESRYDVSETSETV